MKALLDTNVVIALFAGDPAATNKLQQQSELYLCVPVVAELLYGVMASARVTANLARLKGFTQAVAVLPCDEQTAQSYAELRVQLRNKGKPIPVNDLWIAAIARQHGLTILSRDTHFAVLDGVKVEPW